MTMAMRAVSPKATGPKVLRIGLIKSGRVEDERIIRDRSTVTVGTGDSSNSFVIDPPGFSLPDNFKLFESTGGEYRLNFTEKMNGKVGLEAGVRKLDELRKSGARKTAQGTYQVMLSPGSRGKVTIGKATLLFQFVDPPPKTPPPQLPAAARGGFGRNVDWTFTASVIFTYMFFLAGIVYLEHRDWPIGTQTYEIPEIATRLLFQLEPEPEPSF